MTQTFLEIILLPEYRRYSGKLKVAASKSIRTQGRRFLYYTRQT